MTATLEPLRSGRRITLRVVLGLLLVPLTIAGVLLWGLWSPDKRLDTMTAAVVNLDEPVKLNGQTVPMGRVLAAELIGGGDTAGSGFGSSSAASASLASSSGSTDASRNFTWQLTDAEDASAGLDDGRYAAVVTIPEDFSRAATSASEGAAAARTATIGVRTSERGRLLDSALSNIVTTTATSVLNQKLGEQSVNQVLVGMNRLGEGVTKAADGATKLADGGSQLADGVDGLAGGAKQLAAGTDRFVAGAGSVSDGAAGLSTGADKLSSGAGKLSTGVSELAAGAKAAARGGRQLADQVKVYTDGAGQAIGGLQQGAAAAATQLTDYRNAIAADLIPMPSPEAKQRAIAGLDQLIGQLSAAASPDPANQLNRLKAGGPELAAGARESAAGQKQLAQGAKKLAGGASSLATGAKGLADGTAKLADGAAKLAAGGPQLATGTGELAAGTSKLAVGARASADGATSLADGLEQAAAQVPATTEQQRSKLAETMVRPVAAEGGSTQLFNAAGVPLFAGIALWAGALAAFLMLAPLWRRTREAARGVGFITLRSALPALAIGAAQGAIAGLALPPLLGYDAGQWFSFLGLSVLAGAAFALLNQGLSALLGGFGRFLSFALLVVAFAIGVVSTAPPVLQAIGDASPLGALFTGFQAIAMGTSGAGGAFGALVLWGLGGLLLTGLAVARTRGRGPAAPALVAAPVVAP